MITEKGAPIPESSRVAESQTPIPRDRSPITEKATPSDTKPIAATECNRGTTTCGVGSCKNTVQNCVNGIPQRCIPGTARAEICANDIDDNCNGQIDENCKPACTPNWVYSAWGPCSSGVQIRKAYDSNNCMTTTGAPDLTQPCSSLCNSVTQPCIVGVGACTRSGTQTRTCVNGVLNPPGPCSVTPGTPIAEICGNHLDDNCNGQTDENCPPACTAPASQPCQAGFGPCTRNGTQTQSCVNGVLSAPGPCSATPGTPGVEQCGNYIDEDCDGFPDDGCSNPTGHYCGLWSDCASENCVNNFCGTYQGCIDACTVQTCHQVCTPFCSQQCSLTVNPYCATSCHLTCTPLSQPCSVGVGACVRNGTQTRSCVNGVLGASSACSVTPGTPTAEQCYNYVDDNCDGQIDEGCLKQNGQLCSQGSDCQSQNCVFYQGMGICKSHQQCIDGCTSQNCQQSGPFGGQQCTPVINWACAQYCH